MFNNWKRENSERFNSAMLVVANTPEVEKTTTGQDLVYFGLGYKKDGVEIGTTVQVNTEEGFGMSLEGKVGSEFASYSLEATVHQNPVGTGTVLKTEEKLEVIDPQASLEGVNINLGPIKGGSNFAELARLLKDAANAVQDFLRTHVEETMKPQDEFEELIKEFNE